VNVADEILCPEDGVALHHALIRGRTADIAAFGAQWDMVQQTQKTDCTACGENNEERNVFWRNHFVDCSD
jgi:hypothetical protein